MAPRTQSTAARREYGSKAYQAERAALLADEPRCAHPGCRRRATEADHRPPLAAHDHVLGSGCCVLVPKCKTHNASDGAHLRNRKAAQRKAAAKRAPNAPTTKAGTETPAEPRTPARQQQGAPSAPVLSTRTTEHPAPPSIGYIPSVPDGNPEIGRDEPFYASPLPDGVESFGSDVRGWGEEHLGSPGRPWSMMPWQAIALDRQLTHRAGVFAHRQALTSTARQNGKTTGGTKPLVGWWLTERCKEHGPQSVLTTSHKLPLASRFFHQLAPLLEERFGADVKWSYGREHLSLPCGCEWNVTAATPSAGHGTTNDLVVADEIWDIGSACYDDGLLPSTRARPSPLVSCWSTAGTEASEVMLRMREQGLRSIDTGQPGRLCFTSWDLPPGVDPMDERWWRYSNPALGTTITLDTLRAESETPKRTAFLRASLNLWVSSDKAWLEHGAWDALAA